MSKVAVFPGSFDPITRGHVSVLNRALPLFDKIIVAIGVNSGKQSMFSKEQRLEWIQEIFKGNSKIEVITYEGLTVDLCKKYQSKFILRGLRSSVDFEYERSIAHMNKTMVSEIETIFILTEQEYSAINSSIVREIIKNGGDVKQFLPESIKL
jgi:pantetheine-phosphate adenylyltransferase